MVTKVIRADAAKKYKKSVAISFVKNRLTELRSEERRRVSKLSELVFCYSFINTLHGLLSWIGFRHKAV